MMLYNNETLLTFDGHQYIDQFHPIYLPWIMKTLCISNLTYIIDIKIDSWIVQVTTNN